MRLTAPREFARSVTLAALSLMFVAPRAGCQWLEAKGNGYSIFYQKGFENDVPFARTWADRAEVVMRDKYHVARNPYRVSIYLHPAAAGGIDVSSARNRCCSASIAGDSAAIIDMLAPSAPAMRAASAISSLGFPKNSDSYQAKILMSEYIPLGHYAVQNERPAGGWKYYSAPNWFVQGLQEYDAIMHTTDSNRTATAAALSKWILSHTTVVACCAQDLQISDDYNGGAAFMAFLAAEFGEDVHRKLLASSASTFTAALTEQTAPNSRSQLFERFQQWLRAGAPIK